MAGEEKRKLVRIGNSLGITIPKAFIDYHALKIGDNVKLLYRDVVIIIPDRVKIDELKIKKALEVLENG